MFFETKGISSFSPNFRMYLLMHVDGFANFELVLLSIFLFFNCFNHCNL